MDVSRDEKSRSGSISDNHSKPVGGDNENTLTNWPIGLAISFALATFAEQKDAVADPQITR